MKKFFGEPKSHIVFAADLPTFDDNARVLDIIGDDIDVIKISSPMAYREGVGVVRKLVDRYNKPVFADLKVADVPHTSAGIVELVRDQGGSAVMVHGFVGPDVIEDCIDAAQDRVGIIVQIELTSPGGLVFTAPLANDMAKLASQLPVFGTQAPGNRPPRIREIRNILGEEPVIVCCGVGAQGGKHQEVLKAGGTYSIVGRAIYNAPDPAKALADILAG